MIDHIGLYGLLGILFGYLLGSIPYGLVLCKLAGHGDIRKVGSGNIGATNVLRVAGKKLAAATLLLDSSKGLVAVLIAAQFGQQAMYGAALGAVLGHNFPVWLGFKGGKGVAVSLGVFLALNWVTGLAAIGIWLATAFITRISSLSALVAFILTPVVCYFVGAPMQLYLIGLICVIGIVRHHANIRRLLRGEEPKIGKKSK